MNKSGIEYLQNPDGSQGLTVNPVIGCDRISPGCGGGYITGPDGERGGCWAEDLVSTRLSHNAKLPMYKDLARPGGGWSGVVKLVPERLAEIVALGRRKTSSRVFVCDMSDLFHDDVPFEFIAAVFGAMACAQNHLFYVLTKRISRALAWAEWIANRSQDADSVWTVLMQELVSRLDSTPLIERIVEGGIARHGMTTLEPWPLPNVVFGVTCEDPRFGLPRVELARRFPARWRFISFEPLLADLGTGYNLQGYDLAIAGGEAGQDARPHDLQWSRNIKTVADRSGTRFFMKQAGDYACDLWAFTWRLGTSCGAPAWELNDNTGKNIATVWVGRDALGHNWHTWDADGVGHENDTASTIESAKKAAEKAVARQYFHRVSFGKKGGSFEMLPKDLQIRDNIPMPMPAQPSLLPGL